MSFSGSGGPPSKMAREQGLSGGQKPYGFRFYEKLANGKNKRVNFIGLDQDKSPQKIGEKHVKILILDPAPPGGDEWQPSVYIHERFSFNGTWGNYAVCRCKTPEGCLLDLALQEPHSHAPWCKIGAEHGEDECKRLGQPQAKRGAWRWACTAIKLKPYTFTQGKLAGKTIPFQRGLVLAGEDQYKTLLTYRKAWGGLCGRLFDVSRGDGTFAARIGDTWDPVEQWSDEKLMDYFAEAAADYGLDVGDYVKPMNYESILKLPSVDEMAEIAKWVAGERGVKLELPANDPAANPVAAAVADGGGGADDEESPESDLPF